MKLTYMLEGRVELEPLGAIAGSLAFRHPDTDEVFLVDSGIVPMQSSRYITNEYGTEAELREMTPVKIELHVNGEPCSHLTFGDTVFMVSSKWIPCTMQPSMSNRNIYVVDQKTLDVIQHVSVSSMLHSSTFIQGHSIKNET